MSTGSRGHDDPPDPEARSTPDCRCRLTLVDISRALLDAATTRLRAAGFAGHLSAAHLASATDLPLPDRRRAPPGPALSPRDPRGPPPGDRRAPACSAPAASSSPQASTVWHSCASSSAICPPAPPNSSSAVFHFWKTASISAENREAWLDLVEATARDEDVLGYADHLLVIGRRAPGVPPRLAEPATPDPEQ